MMLLVSVAMVAAAASDCPETVCAASYNGDDCCRFNYSAKEKSCFCEWVLLVREGGAVRRWIMIIDMRSIGRRHLARFAFT